MAGGKETPRQKMIGMMYLVLTALLALNVSKEILDAFVSINSSIMANAVTFESKANGQYSEMAALYSQKPEKYGEFNDKAKQLQSAATALKDYLNEFKARVIGASERKDYTTYLDADGVCIPLDARNEDGDFIITKKDENQENTALVYGSNPQQARDGEWSVTELMGKLTDYSNLTQGLAYSQTLKAAIAATFAFPTSTDASGEVRSWENTKFFHVPLAALITELSTIESNVKRVETELMTDIMSNFEAKSYKFTNLEAMVIPSTSYVLRGDTFRAQVFLGAYDVNNKPTIYRSDSPLQPTDTTLYEKSGSPTTLKLDNRGFGEFKIPTSSLGLGEFGWNGLIEYVGPEGNTEQKYFRVPNFTVAEPALVVSPTKMNVFYRGLPNPVEISVPGVPSDKIKPTISAGHTLSKEGNEWVVRPGSGKEAVITVMAELNGVQQKMGDKTFRVKAIPDPVPVFAGKKPSDNTVPLNDVQIAQGVRAEMENFDFEVTVKVTGFSMVFIREGQVIERKSNDNRITSEMTANLGKIKRGDKFYVEQIMVKMPDGTDRKVANISLKAI